MSGLSLVAYCDSSDSETEDVETQNDKKDNSQEGIKKLLSVLPSARLKVAGGRGKQKQPVRIGLPKLEKGDDSDDEDATPVAKRPKPGGSGLSALLPQPKGAVRQQLGAGKKTNSPMMPYTLTKRRQDVKKPTRAVLGAGSKKGKAGDDSDSDDEPLSFFSHLDTPTAAQEVSATTSQTLHSSTEPSSASIDSDTSVQLQSTYSTLQPSSIASHPPVGGSRDIAAATVPSYTPPSFNSAVDPQLHQQPGLRNQWFSQQYKPQPSQPVHYEEDQEEVEREGKDGESKAATPAPPPPPPPPSAMPGTGPGLSIDEEAFRRLAGGKKRRHREENLNNVIELNEDEVKESIKNYQKYYSEESVSKLYKPDNSKIKAPTGDQKRKHQMTYLAHQAKERELELRTHWSSASATRRQAAAKYGF